MEDLRYIVLNDTTVKSNDEAEEICLRAGEIGRLDLRHSAYTYEKKDLLFFSDVDKSNPYYQYIDALITLDSQLNCRENDLPVNKKIVESLDIIINEFKETWKLPENTDSESTKLFDDSGFAYICGGVSSFEKYTQEEPILHSNKSDYISKECFEIINKIYSQISNNPLNDNLHVNMTPIILVLEDGQPKISCVFDKYKDKLEIISSERDEIFQRYSKALKTVEYIKPVLDEWCYRTVKFSKDASEILSLYEDIVNMQEHLRTTRDKCDEFSLPDFPYKNIATKVFIRESFEESVIEFYFSLNGKNTVGAKITGEDSLGDALIKISEGIFPVKSLKYGGFVGKEISLDNYVKNARKQLERDI